MKKQKVIKGFKAYNLDMTCKGFKFEEGKEYECAEAKVCEKGFHLCVNPLDVLNYSDLTSCIFSTAEALGKIDKRDKDTKIATTKIKIGAKLSLRDFVIASVDFLLKTAKPKKGNSAQLAASGHSAQLAASGHCAQLAASGYCAQLATSGHSAQLAASGHCAQLAASGYCAQLAASGDSAKLATSGDSTQLAASGHSAKLAASGHCAKLAASGRSAKLAASGDYAQLAASGHYAKLAASGHSAKLAASGHCAQLAASGDYAQLAASGHYAKLAASGDCAQLEANGKNSIAAGIGFNNTAKAKKGCWIVLAEWKNINAEWTPVCVKTVQIDGEKIKEDVFYRLENGKFLEVK